MTRKFLGIILVMLAMVGIVAGVVMSLGGGLSEALNSLYDGQRIACDVQVDATAISGRLVIEGQPVCTRTGSCNAQTGSLSIFPGQVEGKLAVTYNGRTYAAKTVSENRFDPSGASSYGITACIPGDATEVKIRTMNKNGGTDHEVPASIQS